MKKYLIAYFIHFEGANRMVEVEAENEKEAMIAGIIKLNETNSDGSPSALNSESYMQDWYNGLKSMETVEDIYSALVNGEIAATAPFQIN